MNTPKKTFQAHGKEWYSRTPGDPMPCDGNAVVDILLNNCLVRDDSKAFGLDWSECKKAAGFAIIGWRYADSLQEQAEPSVRDQTQTDAVPSVEKMLEEALLENAAMLEAIKEAAQWLAFVGSCYDNGAWHLVDGKTADLALAKLQPFLK